MEGLDYEDFWSMDPQSDFSSILKKHRFENSYVERLSLPHSETFNWRPY